MNEDVMDVQEAQQPEASAAPDGVPVSGDGEVDPQVIALALATGAQVLDFVVRGDDEGLRDFFNQIVSEIGRQKRLMQLLSMEQSDLERLLSQMEQTSVPEPEPEPKVETKADAQTHPVQQLFSPAQRGAKPQTAGGRSLWEIIQGG